MAQAKVAVDAPMAGARPQNIEMTVAEWLEVADNPRQRDTERHLARAKHLLTPSPTHRRVAMAQATGDENRRWKLDGHTRAMAWKRQMVPPPRSLNVSIYYVASQLEAEELYTQFDAAEAVETGGDRVFGAYQALHYRPESKYLMQAGINTAVKVAQGLAEGTRVSSKQSIYRLVADWLLEIRRFDTLNPDRLRFNSALLAAALVTFRKYPDEEKPYQFWARFNDDGGIKSQRADGTVEMDAVEALSRFAMQAKGGMGKRRQVESGRYDIIGKALAAVETFNRDGTYTRGLAAIDPTKYISDIG